MYRAEERAGPEDVGQQALMRGLDTAFPFFVWGCPCLASGVDQMIGHIVSIGNSPAVVPPSLLHDFMFYAANSRRRGCGPVERFSRLERSTVPGDVTAAERPSLRD